MLTRVLAVLALLTLLVPAPGEAAPRAPAQHVTRVQIRKTAHKLELWNRDQLVASYHVAIGPGGKGPKLQEGDKVTPVGRYHVIGHQRSQFKIFLRLDYPNHDDRVRFSQLKKEGKLARTATIGGDIGIHGPPVSLSTEEKESINDSDWTLGCIALDDDVITAVARLVPDGTPVDIED